MPDNNRGQSSGKLTPEQLRQLSNTLSEAQKLSGQQEEILSRILDGEINIGKLRISYLTEFFDTYSKKLDDVARKQSKLNDTFLVLNRKLTESYKAAPRSKPTDKKTADTPSGSGTSGGDKPPTPPPTNNGNGSNHEPVDSSKSDNDDEVKKVYRIRRNREIEEESRAETRITTDQYDAEMEKRERIRSNLDRLARDLQLNEDERANRALKRAQAREQELYTYRVRMMRSLSEQEETLTRSLTRLEELRSQDTIDRENRVLAYRLGKHQELINQQISTQSLYNELMAEQEFWSEGNMTEAVDTTRYTSGGKSETGTSVADTEEGGVGDSGQTGRHNLDPVELESSAQQTLEPVSYEAETADDLIKYFSSELNPKIDELIGELNTLVNTTDNLLSFASTGSNAGEEQPKAVQDTASRSPIENSTETQINNVLNAISYEIANIESRIDSGGENTQNSVDYEVASMAAREVPTAEAAPAIGAPTVEERIATAAAQGIGESNAGGDPAEPPPATPAPPPAGEQNNLNYNEAGSLADQLKQEQLKDKYLRKLQEDRAAYIAKREYELALANDGKLSAEMLTQIRREAAERFDVESAVNEELIAQQEKSEAAKKVGDQMKKDLDTIKTGSFSERKEALKNLTHDADGTFNKGKAVTAALYAATNAISDYAKKLENTINEIANKKGVIDTNLQGSKNKTAHGSYWDQIVKDITRVGAITPYFKQQTFAANVETLVEKGIAFDLKQRAFLMTIQDKVARTFDVANGTLLRLIKIQQEDSTAGRLGMESALTSFLNEMYETSEYMHTAAATVKDSLLEMQSLMSGKAATEVEFQVQKWLGSLSSVGMSDEAVNSIATAFGQITAGQIDGIAGGGAGNLLIMAANEAGLPISDMLIKGIDASNTNKLLQATVNYLAELAESAKDNRVVQQQLASVFGVKASDLKAATNLATADINIIANTNKTYDALLDQLFKMTGSMGQRTSLAEMLANIVENGDYSISGSIASNPVSYIIYRAAKLVDDAAGGIDIPFINAMGFGVDLNTTVSDLMRIAAIGTGLLGSIGPMVQGLANSFDPEGMLETMGIYRGTNLTAVARGSGIAGAVMSGGGSSLSESGYVGNASGSDIKESTMKDAEDSKKQQMIEAKEEAEANQVDVLNATVLKIYKLLDDVSTGKSSLAVRVNNYGLTKASGGTSLGGVGALGNGVLNDSSLGGSSVSSPGSLSSSGNSNSLSSGSAANGTSIGNIDLGGWKLY